MSCRIVDEEHVRQYLDHHLPDNLVPTRFLPLRFVPLKQLPLAVDGKADHTALTG
jgi:hypothetical protein